MKESEVDYSQFTSLDIRIGTISKAQVFEKARNPAYQVWIDFGPEIGVLKTSAQITDLYSCEALIGKQVTAVVNFPKKQIADFMSECLILGGVSNNGVSLLIPDIQVENGTKVS